MKQGGRGINREMNERFAFWRASRAAVYDVMDSTSRLIRQFGGKAQLVDGIMLGD